MNVRMVTRAVRERCVVMWKAATNAAVQLAMKATRALAAATTTGVRAPLVAETPSAKIFLTPIAVFVRPASKATLTYSALVSLTRKRQ